MISLSDISAIRNIGLDWIRQSPLGIQNADQKPSAGFPEFHDARRALAKISHGSSGILGGGPHRLTGREQSEALFVVADTETGFSFLLRRACETVARPSISREEAI